MKVSGSFRPRPICIPEKHVAVTGVQEARRLYLSSVKVDVFRAVTMKNAVF
jgi:hypothetical protein